MTLVDQTLTQWWYTADATIEELYLCLMKEKDDLYYKQAYVIMYLIPIERPAPVFEILISDLSQQVKKELDDRWDDKAEIESYPERSSRQGLREHKPGLFSFVG